MGGRIKGSRVLLSAKFHYPIDTDLPPSQRGLVLCVCVCFHFSFLLLRVFCLFLFPCSLLMAAAEHSLADGIIALLQMEDRSKLDPPCSSRVRAF